MRADLSGARLRAAAARARDGSAAAFREVVESTHETVFRLAAALMGDRDEAADVAQETYVRAWAQVDELRDPAAALSWLCRIARNVAHERRRGWWARIRAPLDDAAVEGGPADPAPPADESLAAAETAADVRRALARLPEKHRVVLGLREGEGMSYDEIAAALEIPVGTVESRLHRARQGLARRLARLRREERP